MDTLQFRTFTPDLEVRSGGDGRTITGIAVPWGAPQRINDNLTEEWSPGAFNHQLKAANRVSFAREHMDLGGTLIGPVTALRNDGSGLYMEARASRTPVGDETLELVRDGALRDLSIGFRSRPGGDRLRSDGTVVRSKADLFEIAVVRQGAFGDLANVTGIRSHSDGDRCAVCGQATGGPSNLDVARQVLASLPMLPV